MLAAAFLSDGFKTCGEAENGQEAIGVARQISPDLIILDLSMPVMNGLEAAPQLRKLFPKTPIILFTLYDGDRLLDVAASKAGVSLILAKTVPVAMLIDKAHELMSNQFYLQWSRCLGRARCDSENVNVPTIRERLALRWKAR